MYLHNSKRITYSTSTTNYFWSHPNTTRWVIPFSRNFEVLKIYKWVCQNILNNKESLSLITYYFSTHLNFHSRKNILKNICFISQSFKYTVFTSWFLLKYYIRRSVFKIFKIILMIPKIIHYCWVGKKEIPEKHARYPRTHPHLTLLQNF